MNEVIETKLLFGTWRRFGRVGPVYEIIGSGESKGGNQTIHVRVVESGEEFDYKLLDLLEDPVES